MGYIHEKRKETNSRAFKIRKRDLYKSPLSSQKKPTKEPNVSNLSHLIHKSKRDLQKSPTSSQKRPTKEPYIFAKEAHEKARYIHEEKESISS